MDIVAVTDRKQSVRPFLEQIERIAAGRPDMIVLREKDLSKGDYKRLAVSVMEICSRHGVEFCINTHADIAAELGAGTVWVPYPEFIGNGRPRIGNVGVSVHSVEEALNAVSKGADFLVYGNVFTTSCKPGKPAAGFSVLDTIAERTDVPVYAIGGIDKDNATLMKGHGQKGICMMSGFMTSDDPAALIEELRISTS